MVPKRHWLKGSHFPVPRRRHCTLRCTDLNQRVMSVTFEKRKIEFLRRCGENCHVTGPGKPGRGSALIRSHSHTSLIVFQAWVPIQMQTPGGAFALWPRALEEIDKQLLVSQTELKGVGVEGRVCGGPRPERPEVTGVLYSSFNRVGSAHR